MASLVVESECCAEVERIRAVFGLPDDAPLPVVNADSLLTYHSYLTTHLSFPFQALYAESKPPIRHLVHYITVRRLVDLERQPLEGIFCQVDGIHPTRELSLVEIGVRDECPNYQVIDDYAFWFLNYR